MNKIVGGKMYDFYYMSLTNSISNVLNDFDNPITALITVNPINNNIYYAHAHITFTGLEF